MSSAFNTIVDLLTRIEFVVGVLFGGLALAGYILGGQERQKPGWGLAFASASIVGIFLTSGPQWSLLAGVIILALGGRTLEQSQVAGWSLITAGAAVIGAATSNFVSLWLSVVSAAVAAGVGFLLAQWKAREDWPVFGILMLLSVFGMWTTLPETNFARVVVGASAPLALATLPRVRARITTSGAFAVGGLIAWIGATGGVTRPASTIGAWACLGLALIVPFMAITSRRRVEISTAALISLHLAIVAIAARVIGLWESTSLAVIAAAGLLGLATFTAGLLARDSRSQPA